ncbi:hypothetical protein PAPYR_8813 [Paratrimastix pyriformis]|uniref:Uncharacterized protein n=1 Tax=Paratrimastix pyriformis TaxID=342808 RepID=A0ABQ8UBA1_9EUKA|nr:hypothetical protein PAPYR_8813 [Paratrimastix pyriformis]
MRCDLLIAQKDKSTAGTDMTCQILFDQFLMSVPFCVLAVQVFTLSWFGFITHRDGLELRPHHTSSTPRDLTAQHLRSLLFECF